MESAKILVTGGAGYVGSTLVNQLLRSGKEVKVVDYLANGGDALLSLYNVPGFEFVKADIRDVEEMEKQLDGVDVVVHLAAIVGDPACAKEPNLARSINFNGSMALYDLCEKKGVKRFIFASTCSNYGKMADENLFVNEDSELRPVSIYAETKVGVEQYLLNQPKVNICKPTCLRFSTIFGISPCVRFDLTVNEFTKELALGRELIVFGEQFWRPYCHVYDIARAINTVIGADIEKVAFGVFNVGDTTQNYQKKTLVEYLLEIFPDASIKYVSKIEDPRDYRVEFAKINNTLDYKTTISVRQGMEEIAQAIRDGVFLDPDDKKYVVC